MKSVVTTKGQVTIPKRLRDRLGIRPGQMLDFDAVGGKLVALKTNAVDPFDKYYGILDMNKSTEQVMKELRGKAVIPSAHGR